MGKQSFNEWFFTAIVFVLAMAAPLLVLGAVAGWLHWNMVLPGIATILVLIGVIWVNVDALRWFARVARQRSPAEILDERLARGEIDVEEYHRLRNALQEAARSARACRSTAGRRSPSASGYASTSHCCPGWRSRSRPTRSSTSMSRR